MRLGCLEGYPERRGKQKRTKVPREDSLRQYSVYVQVGIMQRTVNQLRNHHPSPVIQRSRNRGRGRDLLLVEPGRSWRNPDREEGNER